MEMIFKTVKELKPYPNNPRKNGAAVDAVAASIRDFGFKVPIVIDSNNVVVCGHTRLQAAKKLKLKEVPCIIADDLSEEQIKAFRLADNKVSELAEWDFDLLDLEIGDIFDFDMEDYGFDLTSEEEEEVEHMENAMDNVDRVTNLLNLGIANYEGEGLYDIPHILPVQTIPAVTEWIGFNYVLSDKNPEGKGVHFFIDDYQFERVWNDPGAYIDKLSRYACVMAPDFSPYEDMPAALQIYNHYRKHWVARLWQENGITVIPTIRASRDERSLNWYLDGEPHGGVVAISAVWTRDEDGRKYFLEKEYKTMIERLDPSRVIVYGGNAEELALDGNVEYIETFSRGRFGNG